jgi:pilus assembly protein FimV
MSRKLYFLGVLWLLLAPGAALSLGLGEIRLNSYLNQPINAEIALNLASPGELDSLQVALAPAEAFRRHGIDRPAYFDDLRFQVQPTGAATAVVRVSSTRPITEPFVTFLVEARWSGGRILREYTVLLDPPVFMPGPDVDAAPAPPPALDAPRPAPAPIARPAPAPAPAPAAAPPRVGIGADYSVQRNDTLWAIAQRVRPDESISTNQVMVALFRENPHAFDGNINRLRAGTILRVPSRQQIASVSGGEATAEVRRQTEDWRAAVAVPVERRLELAPPVDTARAPAPREPVRDPATAAPELLEAVQELRSELAETRRLMEVKDAEIAALQARLAELESEPVDAPPAPVVEAPVEAEPEPVARAPEPEPRAVAPPPPPAPSFMDRVFGALGNLWLWLVIAIVLIATAIAVFLRKRKDQERSIEDDLAETGTWGALDESGGRVTAAAAAAAVGRKFEPRARRAEQPGAILVEEAESPAPRMAPAPEGRVAPPDARPETEPRADEDYQYPFEDTIAGETGINLDQSDPMAEADFHMAYGLYDQAAEIIKKAVEREPDRYDLRRKLIDICFVWGNAEEFLAQAKAIRQLEDEHAAADWSKIAIMGRQLCPGEAMFEKAETIDVDLDLGEGESAWPAEGQDARPAEDWLDFDVGESDESLQVLGDTREQPVPGLDTVSPEHTAELNLEELGMDLDLGESGEHALQDLAERAPELSGDLESGDEDSYTGTLRLPGAAGEAEDEIPAPEEEDAGGTQMLDPEKMRRLSEDPTQRGEGWELAEEEPTLSGVGGYEDEQDSGEGETRLAPRDSSFEAETLTGLGDFELEDEESSDRTFIKKIEPSQEAPTTKVGGFDDDEDEDLGLEEFTQSLKAKVESEDEDEEDAIESTQMTPSLKPEPPAELDFGDTAEMAPTEMDEVGTKLDLARAYIDMGDPDGARSILGEVVEEGNEAQRDEARQLLDTLD